MATAHAPHQPSFLGSVVSGISGYAKGLLAGGALGAIAGAVIGLSVGLVTGGVGTAVLAGTGYGAALFAGIGALAGTVTGVVKSREAVGHSAHDIAKVANISFAQGVAFGHNLEAAEHMEMSFREREEQRRTAALSHQHNR